MIVQLFQQISRLPPKIFHFLNLGILGIILSVLFWDQLKFPFKEQIIIATLVLLALLLLIVLLAQSLQLVFLLLECHGTSILGKSCEYVCQFDGDQGTLATDVYFELMNISFSPQRLILHDAEGFAAETNFHPSYSLIRRSTNPTGTLTPMYSSKKPELRKVQDFASGLVIHQAEWAVLLNPPLLPFERICFLRHSIDSNTELRAFSSEGTIFMFRCRIPYRRLAITVVAPIGYRLLDVTASVDDDSGHKVSERAFTHSLTMFGQRSINWMIPFPGTHRRYKLALKLKAFER